jgi:predicted ATPase/class 3 adenylate cyclase
MALPLLCPACGATNPPADKFCGECGGKLADPTTSGAAVPARLTHTAERRQLTVMFCDLVGSTGLSARLDPEDMRDLMVVYRKCITDVVARFDGRIALYLGDGVLVYFGYPQAHEDDAERAVRVGLALVAAMDGIKTSAGEQLRARIGIATGLVVVGEQIEAGGPREYDAIGETPNLAARLQTIASPGEVVIAASTRRLVGRMFDYRAPGAIELKGLPQPVEAWQVRGERAGISRFEALHTAELTPLVGRQEEIELLLCHWYQAKLGKGRVVLLAGEPGIGKSRIAESLHLRFADEPHVRLRYFCSPYHMHSALYPFIAQLERAAGFEQESGAEARLDKLEALFRPTVRNAPQELALIAELLAVPAVGRYPVLEVSPQQKREMTLAALLNQLEGVAAKSPVLIVFEDVHWIDPTSLDLLDRTVVRIADLPALLLITFRPKFQPTWVGQSHVTMLKLSRLGRSDGGAIIAGVTRGKALPNSVAEQILVRADGVPLFIEELTSTLLEGGLLRETPDRYVLDGPLPPLAIPMTLQDSLVARLDRLATVKNVAQIGAAIGREFSHELIAAVASLSPVDLDAALERLTASGLISRRGAPPEATYSFKHVLVQDAAYTTLLKSRRAELHARIAKVLIERFQTLAETLPETVAHHLAEAGLPSEAIGYWRKAGVKAFARWSNREAVEYFEQALTRLTHLPETRETRGQAIDLRCDLRNALYPLAEYGRIKGYLREAESLSRELSDQRRLGWVSAYMSSLYLTIGGNATEARTLAQRAEAIAEAVGEISLHDAANYYLAWASYIAGDYRDTEGTCRNLMNSLKGARNRERFGVVLPAVQSRAYLARALAEQGDFDEGDAHGQDAIRLAETFDDPFNLSWACLGLAHVKSRRGDLSQATGLLERALAQCQQWKIGAQAPIVLALLGYVNALSGRVDEGVLLLQRAVTEYESTGMEHFFSISVVQLGEAYLLAEDSNRARACAERAVMLAGRRGERGFEAWARRLLGDIASRQDRPDGTTAEAHYSIALARACELGMRPLAAHCHLGLGKLYRSTNKSELVQEHFFRAATMYREMNMRFWLEQVQAESRRTG